MDYSSECDQIHRKLWIWSHLLEKSLMENFIFCAVVKASVILWFAKSLLLIDAFSEVSAEAFKNIINPSNCLLKKANFSIKISNE